MFSDFEEGHLRPSHYTTNLPLTVSANSQNIQQTGDLITLPYTDVVLVDQPYASALENVNPFNVFTFIGDIKLVPESDDWVDTKSLSALQGPTVEGNFVSTSRRLNATTTVLHLFNGVPGRPHGLVVLDSPSGNDW